MANITDKQAAAARANGAKSKGPVTEEGRARVAGNALKHGFCASSVLLPGESKEEFGEHLRAFHEQFEPATAIEAKLVETMAVAQWRLQRLWALETDLLTTEVVMHTPEIEKDLRDMTAGEMLAQTFRRLADGGRSLDLLMRYEGTLSRMFNRALKQLEALRRVRLDGPQAKTRTRAPEAEARVTDPEAVDDDTKSLRRNEPRKLLKTSNELSKNAAIESAPAKIKGLQTTLTRPKGLGSAGDKGAHGRPQRPLSRPAIARSNPLRGR